MCPKGIELVAIGCSTGGPPALQHLFQSLPLLPIPFVVAQHMPASFTGALARRRVNIIEIITSLTDIYVYVDRADREAALGLLGELLAQSQG